MKNTFLAALFMLLISSCAEKPKALTPAEVRQQEEAAMKASDPVFTKGTPEYEAQVKENLEINAMIERAGGNAKWSAAVNGYDKLWAQFIESPTQQGADGMLTYIKENKISVLTLQGWIDDVVKLQEIYDSCIARANKK